MAFSTTLSATRGAPAGVNKATSESRLLTALVFAVSTSTFTTRRSTTGLTKRLPSDRLPPIYELKFLTSYHVIIVSKDKLF